MEDQDNPKIMMIRNSRKQKTRKTTVIKAQPLAYAWQVLLSFMLIENRKNNLSCMPS